MQMTLDLSAPPLKQARAVGEIAMKRATAAAERRVPSFADRAQALILEKLKHGPASGEDCTDYVRAALPMKDGRALGTCYAVLAKRGLIEQAGACKRKRGHGTAGGIVWRLTTPGPVTRNESGQFKALETV